MFAQLSGVPGSGKSTLARLIAQETGFVVIDTDVLKSALIEAGVPVAQAGKPTYVAALALAADLLAQGHSVILDSPCRYPELLTEGLRIADAACVRHGFIELWSADPAELLPRLDARAARISQVRSSVDPVDGTAWEFGSPAATLTAWQAQLVRPQRGFLRLDAARSPSANLADALAYLAQRARATRPSSHTGPGDS